MDPSIAGLIGAILGASVALISVFVQARLSGKAMQATYRLAAVDKRLEVHQEAFTCWINIFWSIHEEKVANLVLEAQEWWTRNCIYLDPRSRDAFRKFLINAHSFRVTRDSEERKQLMAEFMEVGDFILEGVALPPVGADLAQEIRGG